MTFFYFLAAFKSLLLGAVYGRIDGGGIAKVSEWVERSLIMFFFVIACSPFAGLWALFAYAGVLGTATGHGQYFPSLHVKAIKPQGMDFIVRALWGKDPRTLFGHLSGASQKSAVRKAMNEYGMTKLYWRAVTGMFVTGFFVGLPAFIISMVFAEPAGVLFLLTGVAKAAAYMIGQAVWGNTESAEYINGGLRTAVCIGVLALCL